MDNRHKYGQMFYNKIQIVKHRILQDVEDPLDTVRMLCAMQLNLFSHSCEWHIKIKCNDTTSSRPVHTYIAFSHISDEILYDLFITQNFTFKCNSLMVLWALFVRINSKHAICISASLILTQKENNSSNSFYSLGVFFFRFIVCLFCYLIFCAEIVFIFFYDAFVVLVPFEFARIWKIQILNRFVC